MAVSINITADARGVLRAIASTVEAMRKLDAASKSNELAVRRTERALAVMSSSTNRISESEARRVAGLARVRVVQDVVAKSAEQNANSYNKLTQTVDRTASAIARAVVGGSLLRATFISNISAIQEYAKANDSAAASLDKIAAASARFKTGIGRDLAGSGGGVAGAIDTASSVRSSIVNLYSDVFRFQLGLIGLGKDGSSAQIDALRRTEEQQTAMAKRIKETTAQNADLRGQNDVGAFAAGDARDTARLLFEQEKALAAIKGDDAIAENLRLQTRIRYNQQLFDIQQRMNEAAQRQIDEQERAAEAERQRARDAQATLEAQRERIELGTRESQVERLRMLGDERGALIAQNRLDFLRKESEIGGMNLPAQDAMAALNSLKTESDATLRIALASFDANAIANASRNATVRNVQTGLFGLGGELAGNALAGGGGAAQAAANAARTAANTAEAAALLKDIKAGIENSGAVWAP